MSGPPILTNIAANGIATVTLNRPEVHNAFDDDLIAALDETLRALEANTSARLVELRSTGKSFSAGADLNWMRRVAQYSHEENAADATRLATLLHRLHTLTKPTIAVVQGSAFGGGVGLISCCDIAIALSSAKFSFSEVKLGLIPATISPFVINAIGARNARRLFLTGEIFTPETALELGLIHHVATDEAKLDDAANQMANTLVAYGRETMSNIKSLVDAVAGRPIDKNTLRYTAQAIATQRGTPEGREGISAFLQKRKPVWPQDDV